MTDEVADLVLRDNYEQNVALANARRPGARRCCHVHTRFIRELERTGGL